MTFQKVFYSAKCRDIVHLLLFFFLCEFLIRKYFHQIKVNCFLHKHTLRILRKNTEQSVIQILDFRNALLPVEFSAISPNAIAYFEGLGASSKEPVFTKIWGLQISETVVRTITEESAFGLPSVREVRSSRKDFVITGASPTPYVWDDEGSITAQELMEAMTARETAIAAMKQRQDEYKASRGNAIASAPASVTVSGFNF